MTDCTQTSILRITDQKTMQLIELYEREPCLWNTLHADYRSRARRARAAARVARDLRIRHFEGRHVLMKFKNLRNSYCQELKKIANSLNSLNDDEVYRPRVFWFDKMDSFLRPHLQPARSNLCLYPRLQPGTTEVELIEETELTAAAGEGGGDWQREVDVAPTGGAGGMPPDEPGSDGGHPPSTDEEYSPRARRRRRRPRRALHVCVEQHAAAALLRTISRQLERLARAPEDAFDMFGRYVASLLRALPPARAGPLQPRIAALLAAALVDASDAADAGTAADVADEDTACDATDMADTGVATDTDVATDTGVATVAAEDDAVVLLTDDI